MRAFSLIEVSVAVAILGVAAALAVPVMLPVIHKSQLDAATESAAGLLARARSEAMHSKRCVRVRLVAPALVVERMNSFDCEQANPGTPYIDTGVASAFIQIDKLKAESPKVTFAFSTTPAAPGGELRIRPNGRSFSNDVVGVVPTLTNDDAVITVTHTLLPAGNKTRLILYNSNGLICAAKRGQALIGAGPDFDCP